MKSERNTSQAYRVRERGGRQTYTHKVRGKERDRGTERAREKESEREKDRRRERERVITWGERTGKRKG